MALFGKRKKTSQSADKKSKTIKDKLSQTNQQQGKTDADQKTKDSKGRQKSGDTAKFRNVLIKPLITEKSSFIGSFNQYVFMVRPYANKVDIAREIEALYGVKPRQVRIVNVLGKKVRSGRGLTSRRKNWKKAIVSLPQGKTIDVYES